MGNSESYLRNKNRIQVSPIKTRWREEAGSSEMIASFELKGQCSSVQNMANVDSVVVKMEGFKYALNSPGCTISIYNNWQYYRNCAFDGTWIKILL